MPKLLVVLMMIEEELSYFHGHRHQLIVVSGNKMTSNLGTFRMKKISIHNTGILKYLICTHQIWELPYTVTIRC